MGNFEQISDSMKNKEREESCPGKRFPITKTSRSDSTTESINRPESIFSSIHPVVSSDTEYDVDSGGLYLISNQVDKHQHIPPRSLLPKYLQSTETLPEYTPKLEAFGLNLIKLEFLTPYTFNPKGLWQPMLMELNSTQLILYKLKTPRMLSKLLVSLFLHINKIDNSNNITDNITKTVQSFLKLKPLKSLPQYFQLVKENKFLFEPVRSRQDFQRLLVTYDAQIYHIYTLNNFKAGIAPRSPGCLTDVKYHNVLRMRLEMNQILVQFWSFSLLSDWYWFLSVGKDLSGSFEMMPKDKNVPQNLGRVLKKCNAKDAENTIVYTDISNYLFYTRKLSTNDEIYLRACIPQLDSFHKWQDVIVSSGSTKFDLNFDQKNLLVVERNVLHTANNKGGFCRYFTVQTEGLVSVIQ